MIKILETGKCSAKTILRIRKPFYTRGPAFQTVEDGLGRNGLDCRVDWSSTLTNWTTLMTSPNPEGALDVTDTTAPGAPHRFYRVVQP